MRCVECVQTVHSGPDPWGGQWPWLIYHCALKSKSQTNKVFSLTEKLSEFNVLQVFLFWLKEFRLKVEEQILCMSVSSVIQIRLDIKPITPAPNIPLVAPWPWWPITGQMWGLQTNEISGDNHPSSVIQLRIIQSILMKELKFVLVGVYLNFAGMLLWLMARFTNIDWRQKLSFVFYKVYFPWTLCFVR